MQIIPAIDIKNRKIVRLYQGDYKKETIYKNNPVDVAMEWKNQGAKIIHVVDLDGAKEGKPKIIQIAKQIINETQMPIQVGGGIRNLVSIYRYIDTGVSRIILGTIALENINLLKEAINTFGEKIVVSLDVKNHLLMKKGWLQKTTIKLLPTIRKLEKLGVKTIIYTDIDKDGMLTGLNYEMINALRKSVRVNLIIAGGVSSINQIKTLKAMKINGVIIGKALYENKINLKEAIKYVS